MKQNLKLTIELVPASSWNYNLRSLLKPHMWKAIREETYRKYNNKCAICLAEVPLHAHEVWHYDKVEKIQSLVNIVALCKNCHLVKHFGLTELEASKGNIDKEKVIKHFLKINNCTKEDFYKHYKKAKEQFEERSKYDWQLNIEKF